MASQAALVRALEFRMKTSGKKVMGTRKIKKKKKTYHVRWRENKKPRK